MSYKIIKKKMFDCTCERCGYNWITDKLPHACSGCKSIAWNKPKKEKKQKKKEVKNGKSNNKI